jgi:tryptophan-rich sensory protein
MDDRIALVALLGASAAAEGAGAWLTSRSVATWYPTLVKPLWTPPGWIFGPVWTLLYLLMAVAAWLVWRERLRHPVGPALTLYVVQLIVNVAWSGLFFGLQDPAAGLVGIGVLWVAIGATMTAFWRARRLAAWLLAPYAMWVTYAAALNWALWRLNA